MLGTCLPSSKMQFGHHTALPQPLTHIPRTGGTGLGLYQKFRNFPPKSGPESVHSTHSKHVDRRKAPDLECMHT